MNVCYHFFSVFSLAVFFFKKKIMCCLPPIISFLAYIWPSKYFQELSNFSQFSVLFYQWYIIFLVMMVKLDVSRLERGCKYTLHAWAHLHLFFYFVKWQDSLHYINFKHTRLQYLHLRQALFYVRGGQSADISALSTMT